MFIDGALKEGAELVCGGQRLREGDLAHGFFMQPTLLTNVTPKMRIARDEVFGPVVAIMPVNDFEGTSKFTSRALNNDFVADA